MITRLRGGAAASALLLLASGALGIAPAHAATVVANAISTTSLAAAGGPTAAGLAGALIDTTTGITVVANSAKFTGNPNAAGLVNISDPSIVSFNKGVILSSGDIANVIGPNKSDGITGDMGTGQDDSLTALIANTQTVNPMTYDAAVLEFDITAPAKDIYFTYVFGSDEYLEWVNLYNDVFAFWINGTNCATVVDTVTGTAQPVTIDTINDQVNAGSYRDNSFAPAPTNPLNIEMDGLSVELICHAVVTPNQPAHIKLAIADTSDQILDSVVILKSGTLSTTKPESCNNKVDDDGDAAIDMDDSYCKTTTTTPLISSGGLSGSGSGGLPAAFTGNEGETIALDAAAIGWYPAQGTAYTYWTLSPINGTTGTCTITSPLWLATIPDVKATNGLRAAVATATCSTDGEYVARVAGYETYGATTNDTGGTDIDFFVHNAPPTVEPIASTVSGQLATASALVYDLGANDTVTCSVAWGDGSKSAGAINAATDECTASHTYAAAGTFIVSLTGKDNQGASAAAAAELTIAPFTQPPTVTGNPAPASVMAGAPASFHATASGAPAPSIQWQSLPVGGSWAPINGATSETYTIPSPVLGDSGKQFRAVFTNGSGTATSTAATLTVTSPSTLTGFSPTAGGGVGTSVTLTGTGFTSASTVNFNGKAAIAVFKSPTQLLTSVPTGATTGKITVTTGSASPSSATNFTVSTTAVAPKVSSFTPTSGVVGSTVTVTGSNLVGTKALKLGTVTVPTWTVISATSLTFVVPAGSVTGKVAVTTDGGTGTSTGSFTVTVPKITPTLAYSGSLTASKGKSYTLQGTLTSGGVGVSGKSIKFTFNGKNYSATTNTSGIASVVVTAPNTAASYSVATSFAGDTTYNAVTATTAYITVV